MEKSEGQVVIKEILISVVIAIIVSIIGILVFAFFCQFTYPDEKIIYIVNSVIKALSLFIAITLKLKERLGLIKGGITGAIYSLILNGFFSIICRKSFFSLNLLFDIIICVVLGVIFGIIAVNVFRKKS